MACVGKGLVTIPLSALLNVSSNIRQLNNIICTFFNLFYFFQLYFSRVFFLLCCICSEKLGKDRTYDGEMDVWGVLEGRRIQ